MTAGLDSPTAYLRDKPPLSPTAYRIIGIVASLVVSAAGFWIASHPAVTPLEDVTIDWRFRLRGPRTPPDNIVIVEIDESSREALKHDGRRFDLREHLPAAIDRLADAGALVIGLDIWLEDLTTPEIDRRLADVIATTDIVLAVAYTGGHVKRAPPMFRAQQPAEGVISVDTDRGVLRRLPDRLYLDVLEGDSIDDLMTIPHFPLVLALYAAFADDDDAQITLDGDAARIGGDYEIDL